MSDPKRFTTERGRGWCGARRASAHSSAAAVFAVRCLVVWLLLLVTGLTVLKAEAQSNAGGREGSKAPAPNGPPLRFRRVYAPADHPETWPRQQMPYFPVQPDEFERLLGRARNAVGVGETSVAVAIASAQYKARLEDGDLVDGEATVEVLHCSDHRAMLRLEPCGLAVSKASWAGADGQLAELGQGPDGQLMVLVERSGSLRLSWSLHGQRDSQGTVELPLEFPPSPSTLLTLDLPANVTPLTDCGLVTKEATSVAPLNRWRIELGGHHRVGLRIVPTEALEKHRQQTRVRQSLVYDISPQGLDLSAQLQFDVYNEPLRQVVVALDPGLRLVTVRSNSVAVPWSSMTPLPGSNATRVVLEFPEPLQGLGRTVRLRLLAPLQLGPPWRLPGLRPEGMLWQEGNATLLATSPLVIERLTPIESRQVKVSPLSAPRSGESMELQYFGPNAGAEIVLGHPQSPVQLNCATTVELSGGELTARVTADFSVTDGEVFELEAEASRQWIVDSVESVPGEVLRDWNLEKSEAGSPKLTIRLAKALSPSRPVRLQITGRRLQSPLRRWLGVKELVPLQFRAGPDGRRLISLRGVEPYQLKTTGADRLTTIDPQNVDATAARLLNGWVGKLLFEQDAGAEDLRVSVEPQSSQYAATLRVEAAAMDGSLVESYRLNCIPASTPIARLLVRFSHRRDSSVRWTLVDGGDEALTVRPYADPAWPAGAGSADEIWEITLQQPQSIPFEIRARRTSPLAAKQPISLASLPDAASQRATLVVSSTEMNVVRVEGGQLEPIPAEAVPADQYNNARATYRYYPAHNNVPSPEAVLVVAPRSSASPLPAAWAWNCHLESRYDRVGMGHHLAVYRIENGGCRQIPLTLPPDASLEDLRGVWVDEARASWHVVGAKERRRLVVDLPAGRKYSVLAFHYTTFSPPLRLIRSLSPSLPELEIPVLACQWTAWLPPGYAAVDPDLRWQPQRTPSLTWTERLFGPLGQGTTSARFNPFRSGDWAALVGDRSSRRAAENKSRQLLQTLGESVRNGREPEAEGVDWKTAFSSPVVESILGDQSDGQKKCVLLVDQPALARLGIAPNTPLPRSTNGTPSTRGAALLQQAELTLLVHPTAIVVTSGLGAALDHASLEPLDNGALWWIRPGPLADQVQEAAAGQSGERFARFALWSRQPAEPAALRGTDWPVDVHPSDTPGWTAYELQMSGEAPAQLNVILTSALETLRWSVFLVVVVLTSWRSVGRPAVLLPLAGLLAMAALLVPAAYVPPVSGGFLGILLAIVLRLVSRRDAEETEPAPANQPNKTSSSHKAVSGMPVLLLGMLLSMCGITVAAEPSKSEPSKAVPPPRQPASPAASADPFSVPAPAPAEAKPTAAYNVLIPVDKDAKPTGEPYQVPEGLYKELHHRAAAGTDEPQGWLLTGATYRGSLVWQGTPERLAPGELKASFALQVFSPQTRVRLGLGHRGLNLVPDGATLDGRMIQPEWQEDGTALAFDVEEPGEYQLELALRPTAQSGETTSGFDLSIPRLISAQLELSIPANAPTVEIPSALGTVVRQTEPSRVLAELGPSQRLSVRWRETTAAAPAGPAVDMEELLWLKVQPESVVLDVHFRFRVVEGRVQELRLQTDPRLRLQPLRGENAPTVEVQTHPGQPQTLRLVFPSPVSDQMELAASFLLTETSGIGNLQLPLLETQGVRTTKRWLAVGVDPSLQYEQQPDPRLEAVAVPVFATAWGPTPTQPLFAYSLAAGDTSWGLVTHPRAPSTTATQTLAMSLDQNEAQVQLDAQLKTSLGYHFQYRIPAPPELEVHKVSLQAENQEHVARWSRNREGLITVFLNAPVTGEQRLSLQGRLPTEKRGSVVLPILRIEAVATQGNTIQLFRKPAVVLRVVQAEGLTALQSPVASENTASLGRLVTSFQAKGNQPATFKVALSPNRPKIRATQQTSVRFDGEQREAKADFQIHVEQGQVDQWRLDVPSQWNGPYKVDPPSAIKVVAIPGDNRRRLILQPTAAVSGEYRLSVSGPLTLAPGDQVCAPQIVLQDAEIVEHLLVLPTQWQLHPVAWETQGLKPASLPSDFDALPVGRESFVAYQAERPSFQAILKPLVGLPQVFLADIHLAWQADGTCHGVAQFDLQSAGMPHCWLQLPAGQELIQATVADVPAVPLRNTDQRWQIPLSPSAFPQRLEVLFRGRLAAPSTNGTCQLEAPTLEEWPIRQTTWTVYGPPLSQPGDPQGIKIIEPLEQEMVRLRNVNALIEQAAETTTEDPEQMVQWYRTWASRWLDLGSTIRRQLALPTATATPQAEAARQVFSKELESLCGRQSPTASRLAGTQVLAQLAAETPRTDRPTRLWLPGSDRSRPVLYGLAEGGVNTIGISYRAVTARPLLPRLGSLLVVAGVAAALVWGVRHGRLEALIFRWPHAFGVLVGLAWWLWLWPSVLGWVIVLVNVVAAFRPVERTSRKPATVVVTMTSRKR
jgi:hypothetical protein